MDCKIPLYISAVALFIAVVASLFFFNLTQKIKKNISDIKTDKNTLINIGGRIDSLNSDIDTIIGEIEKIKKSMIPPVKPETLVVDEGNSDEEQSESDIEVESVGN